MLRLGVLTPHTVKNPHIAFNSLKSPYLKTTFNSLLIGRTTRDHFLMPCTIYVEMISMTQHFKWILAILNPPVAIGCGCEITTVVQDVSATVNFMQLFNTVSLHLFSFLLTANGTMYRLCMCTF